MCFKPKDASRRARIDPGPLPPGRFIAATMHLAMMPSTEWNDELIADLAPECRWLGKAQVMGVSGTAAADQARLLGN